jgi:hypothetical protein
MINKIGEQTFDKSFIKFGKLLRNLEFFLISEYQQTAGNTLERFTKWSKIGEKGQRMKF